MSEPVDVLICEDLVETFRRMRKGAGYHFDYLAVDHGESIDPDEYPAVAVLDGEEDTTELAHPLHDNILSVQVRCRAKAFESPSQVGSYMIADVKRAAMQDITRGGLAVSTKVGGRDKVHGWPANDDVIVDVFLKVHYRASLTDPSDAR